MIRDDLCSLPTFFGDYVFEDEIGSGGMKIVVRAYHNETSEMVAVALLKARFPSEEQRERFQREAQALEVLSHPNIVPVIDHGCIDGQLYFAMPLIEGNTLGCVIPEQGFPLREMLEFIVPIGEALRHAHQSGILHRDLKPENILLEADKLPRLIDFGLSKSLGNSRRLTRPGQGLGTRPYVSPEQVRGEEVGPPSDIYSLGVLMLELLLGRQNFAEQVREAHLWGPGAVFSSDRLLGNLALTGVISPAILDVCRKCLQSDPQARYASMDELLPVLSHLRQTVTESRFIEPTTNGRGTARPQAPDTPLEQHAIGSGTVIAGRYTLKSPLQRIGMGEVWKAEDTNRSNPVVIKFLPHKLRDNPDEMKRLRTSFDLVESLHHPNICPLYDLNEDPVAGIFLVMKFIPGIDLAQLCQRRQASGEMFTLPEVLQILFPIAQAIDYAHRAKVTHRDIKPDNIMATPEEDKFFLIDFGLAERIRQTMTRIRVPQEPTGTIHYLAPEVWQGQKPVERSDQYSLGAVAYEMLAGEPPFSAAQSTQVLRQCAIHEPVAALNLSPGVNEVFRQVLSKNPEQRFPSCVAFIEALRRGQPAVQSPVPATRPNRPPFPIAIPALFLTVALSLGITWMLLGNTANPRVLPRWAFNSSESEYPPPWMENPQGASGEPVTEEVQAPELRDGQQNGNRQTGPDDAGGRSADPDIVRNDSDRDSPLPETDPPPAKPTDAEVPPAFAQAMQQLKEGEFLAAAYLFEEAVRQQPDHTSALLHRAHALRRHAESIQSRQGTETAAEHFQKAAHSYTLVLERQPQQTEALVGRGRTKQQLGLAREAIFDFTSALEVDELLIEAYEHRGNAYFTREDFQRAESDFLRLLFLDDTRTDVRQRIAECRHRQSEG